MQVDQSTQKVIISLVSVIIGWLLAQGTDLIKGWWRIMRLKKALILELEDLKHELTRIFLSYERTLQICALKGFDHSLPLPLNHYIYEKNYAEVCPKLNRAQRISYELIHGYVDSLNRGINKLNEFRPLTSHEVDEKKMEEWTQLVGGQYSNARITYWQINFHLDNRGNPDLGDIGSETHNAMLAELEAIESHAKKIMEAAKQLKREDFEKVKP